MVVLARLAGPRANHIVLSEGMGRTLKASTREIKEVTVLNNAGLINPELLTIPLKTGYRPIVLGHLSNLTAEKGIATVVELALAAKRRDIDIRLVVAGPVLDDVAEAAISTARSQLGPDFDYRGPTYAKDKLRFFGDISLFVFPTRYDASPLVLFEAMAAGVPCIATDVGCISEDIAGSGGIAIGSQSEFVRQALQYLVIASTNWPARAKSARERYHWLLQSHVVQVERLVARIGSRQ
jgi:glycosyltransferase involved in cell wall biosynthesis